MEKLRMYFSSAMTPNCLALKEKRPNPGRFLGAPVIFKAGMIPNQAPRK
jgi:hypothetical protein